MTAIAAVWSPEGFVIGSDTLRTDRAGNDVTKGAQKIFSLSFSNDTRFAYAWKGVSFVGSFSFELATERAFKHLPRSLFPNDPTEYFSRLAKQIFCELLNHFGGDSLPPDLSGSEFQKSEALFVGYAKGKPMWVEILFDHDSKRFRPPTIEGLEYPPRCFKIFSGSVEVWKIMNAERLVSQPVNLEEAAQKVGDYVQRCITGRHIFPDCAGIGGQVCLAAVTTKSFFWIPWPLGG